MALRLKSTDTFNCRFFLKLPLDVKKANNLFVILYNNSYYIIILLLCNNSCNCAFASLDSYTYLQTKYNVYNVNLECFVYTLRNI